jgi:hypothetical protein
VAPIAAENFPAAQLVHEVAPFSASTYEPKPQLLQTNWPTVPTYLPSVPTHAVQMVAADSLSTIEPAAHASHTVLPAVPMYSPFVPSHGVQMVAFDALFTIEPAAHASHTVLPAVPMYSPLVPSHGVQVVAPTAAFTMEPAGQASHAVDPSTGVKVPCAHLLQLWLPATDVEPAGQSVQLYRAAIPICTFAYVPAAQNDGVGAGVGGFETPSAPIEAVSTVVEFTF